MVCWVGRGLLPGCWLGLQSLVEHPLPCWLIPMDSKSMLSAAGNLHVLAHGPLHRTAWVFSHMAAVLPPDYVIHERSSWKPRYLLWPTSKVTCCHFHNITNGITGHVCSVWRKSHRDEHLVTEHWRSYCGLTTMPSTYFPLKGGRKPKIPEMW